MSGALASITSLASGPIGTAVLGLLRTASFRGVTFEMLDSEHGAGRRWVRFLFPGRPDTVHEDLGAVDGPIVVNAMLVGEDYTRRARRLEAACKAPGPATLLHPWLGPLQVVCAEPPRFHFSHDRLRVCTVQLVFHVWEQRAASTSLSLGGLLDAVDGLVDSARIFLAGVLTPLGDALGLLGFAQGVLARVGAAWSTVAGSAAARGDGAALVTAEPVRQLGAGLVLLPGETLSGALADMLGAVPGAIAYAAEVQPDPAVGPGPLPPAPEPSVEPRAGVDLLLASLPLLQPRPGELPAGTAMLACARMLVLAEAARTASAVSWESRDEALAARAKLDTAFDAVGAELLRDERAPAGPAWRVVRACQAALGRDIQERVGRLPPVRHLHTFTTLSAWHIALAVAGDDAQAIRPAMFDLVARNRIRHPGLVPPGRLEVLL